MGRRKSKRPPRVSHIFLFLGNLILLLPALCDFKIPTLIKHLNTQLQPRTLLAPQLQVTS